MPDPVFPLRQETGSAASRRLPTCRPTARFVGSRTPTGTRWRRPAAGWSATALTAATTTDGEVRLMVDPLWKAIAETLDRFVKPVLGDEIAHAVATDLRAKFTFTPVGPDPRHEPPTAARSDR